jgi:hypothetical protein
MTTLRRYFNLTTDSDRWNRFEFRPGDIVISTPPKAGTTLTQMMTALLVFDDPDLPAALDELSPWLDMTALAEDEVFSRLEAQTHRRFIKTHTPLDGVPERDDVVYLTIARDPRDVFVSWQHHVDNMDLGQLLAAIDAAIGLHRVEQFLVRPPDDVGERFDLFVDDEDPTQFLSAAGLAHQMQLQWDHRERPNVCSQHFTDVTADPVAALGRIATVLGLEPSTERLAELAEAAHIDAMRSRAADRAPTRGLFTDPAKFFRAGGSGEWRSIVTDDQLERYWEAVSSRASPEVVDWMHHGEAGA